MCVISHFNLPSKLIRQIELNRLKSSVITPKRNTVEVPFGNTNRFSTSRYRMTRTPTEVGRRVSGR